MNTVKSGAKQTANSPRPRREKPMLDRALEYAKLYNGGRGKKASEIAEQYDENEVTIYKLVRLGEAPKAIISLIRKGEIPATVVANTLKASMSHSEMIEAVNALVKERHDARQKLAEAGFKGGTSMTLRRAFTIAIDNLKKRHLIKGENRKAIVRALNAIVSETKPTVQSIEEAVLMN